MTNNIPGLCAFLTACGGNWRNTIFISCQSCPYLSAPDCAGYLLAVDSVGRPVIVEAARFCQLSKLDIDSSECRGHLDRQAFEDVFARFLVWQVSASHQCPLKQLAAKSM